MEDEEWSWDDPKMINHASKHPNLNLPASSSKNESWQNKLVDNVPVKGARLLYDIYYRCNIIVCEPTNYEEAKKNQIWVATMKEKLSIIEKIQTWHLVERPQDKNVFGFKWVYKTKLNVDGSINKNKARIVVKGYAQVFGVDYLETFSLVARLDTIRLLLVVAAQKNWRVYQLDVKSTFLNGFLQEEIYVEQPQVL